MIANLEMIYLEKPYGLIKARIPNIKLNLEHENTTRIAQ